MEVYLSGSIVHVKIPFLDSSNAPVEPTAVSYRLLSETGEVLIDTTQVNFNAGDTECVVIVPAEHNTLTQTFKGMRLVDLTMETALGPIVKSHRYIIESPTIIEPGVTSFMTYSEALLESHYMIDVDTWTAATEREQRAALIQAHQNLLKLRYTTQNTERDNQQYLNLGLEHDPFSVWRMDLNKLTITQIKEVSLRFFQALCKAQIAEADYLLGGETIDDKRKIGLLSETVGESSNMFRTGKPLKLAIGEKALGHLAGYIDWTLRIRR